MKKKHGFTLLEVVATILIIGILASIAIPSIMNYVEAGNNQSRNNIARTLYMAAQGQLTQMKLTKNLSEFTEDLYAPEMSDGHMVPSLKHELNLYSEVTMPAQEKEENRNSVTYIIKDKGDRDTNNLVYRLLNPVVLDKSILNDTICVEFNTKTGVVLSVFYSDVAEYFAYSGTGKEEDISGNRPYTEGAHRRQGYYGINQTGELPLNLGKEQVDIIDGSDNRIADGALHYENALYGQILVPAGENHYKVSLVKADKPELTYYTMALDDMNIKEESLNMAIASANNEKPAIYKDSMPVIKDGIPYDRYVWIIDFIGDGTFGSGGQTYSLYDNTSSGASKDLEVLKSAPVNLRIKLNKGTDTQSDNGIKSLSFANSFFGGEDRSLILKDDGSPALTLNYKIQSARHLNHIRNCSEKNFRQTGNIDMAGVDPFEPIEVLKGSYTGVNLEDKDNDRNTQYKIENLSIRKNTGNVGLFARVDGVDGGTIRGVSIVNGTIEGTSSCNIGAIAGEVINGGIVAQSNSLSNVSVTNGQEANAGGLVGLLSNDSLVNQCYNSGSGSVLNREHFGSVIVKGSGYTSTNIGGLVGLNQGTIQYGYNNGRVNIDSVRTGTGKEERLSILKEDGQSYSNLQMANSNKAYLGGIAGNNLGSILNSYANNFVGKTTNPDQCRNGGLVGIGNEAKQSYYLSNKTVDQTEFGLNKILLSNRDFSVAFQTGLGYPPQNEKYPYPTLRGNKHSLPWEDIQGGEASIATTFKYYELYTNGSMGFSYGDQKKSTLVTNGAIVANDGYCIDFTYSNKYTLVIGNKTFDLTANGAMENPEWSWASGNMTNLPIKVTENGKSFFRLYLNNSVLLERANPDGSKPIKIQLISFGRKMLEGSSDKNSMGEETDVYFNPLFADAIVTNRTGGAENNSWSSFTIRSPRQLDNVDYVAKAEFKQTADIDFAAYKKELKIAGGIISLSLNETDKVKPEAAIIKGTFAGTYSGESHYIRNVIVSMPITAKSDPVGLFSVVNGKVQNLALIEATFIGRGNVGGLAGVVEAGGEINLCQVSQVTAEGRISTGGVVGENKGTVTNVYFNTIKRNKDGVFESPVSGGNNIGGMIGNQLGNFTNAYTTTLGPTKENEIHPTVGKGSVGVNVYYLSGSGYNSNVKDSNSGIELDSLKPNTLKAEVMFSGNSNWENATVETTLLTKDLAGKAYPFAKLKGMNHYCDWPILVTTLKYYEKYSDGTLGYFYYIGDTTPANSLKYDPNLTVVEEGYFVELIAPGTYNVRFDNASTNDISNRESTVFEGRRVLKFTNKELDALIKESNIQQDGILPVKMQVSLNEGTFSNILFGTNEDEAIYFNPFFAKQIFVLKKGEVPKPQKTLEVRSPRQMMKIDLSKARTSKTIVEGPVIKIANDNSYYYYEGGRYAPTPTTDIKANPQIKLISGYGYNAEFERIETLPLEITESGSSITEKTTVVKQTIKYVYIYGRKYWSITNTETTTKTTTTTTVESSVFGSNQTLWAKGYDYNQTISLNFAQTEVDGRPIYTMDGETLPEIGRNVIPGLTGTYNGMSQEKVFRIYNLIMNVESSGSAPFADNTGATFGDIGTNAKVSNLEFINPQIRYDKNGRGGGIVANINYGFIDNVKVYNTKSQSLFANMLGKTDTAFCYSNSNSSYGYGHNHGGIAAQSIGPKPGTSGTIPRITNCVVGTNSNKIEDIADNDTKICCYQENVYGGEQFTNRIGGIVGFVYGESKIISCVNIAKLDVSYKTTSNTPQSPYAMGGIAGAIGVRELKDLGKTVLDGYGYDSYGKFKASPGYVIGCYNAGSLRLNNGWLGGIVGYPATNSVITSCYNTGRINIEDNGRELVETPVTGRPIRIGGIAGETDKATLRNCYNVGYLSGLVVQGQANSAAGAIMALPAYGNTTMESCYSLAADQYRPVAIVGKLFGGGTVNYKGEKELDSFKTWVSRLNLRNNTDLINTNKGYPVFTPSSNSFYSYPQLSSFVVDGVTYKNPHITPWEYIDAIYDTTLNYYERYQDGSYGYYYCDLKGEPVDQLSYDKTVQEDGYFLEIGKADTYKVIINGKDFTISTENFNGKTIIRFNAAMTQAFTLSGYQKVQLYTILRTGTNGAETNQDKEDNIINRIIGSTTIFQGTAGIDLYFDPMFPKEIKYGDTSSAPVKPKDEPYRIRGVRHLENIGKLTAQVINGTEGKAFKQETLIDFNNTPRGQSIISGEFLGSYNGNYKTIKNLTITGDVKTTQIGLFAINKGTIEKLQMENPRYTGNSTSGTLNMGILTAENMGQINCIAIVSPQLKEAISGAKNIGGIAGINQGTGIIQDVYLIAKNTAPSPFSVSSNANAGGLIGRNEGYLGFSYYLAKAPVTNQPIMGSNTNPKLYFNTLCYLAGTSYNNFAKEQTIGTAYKTSEFAQMTNDDWFNWEKRAGYPYLSLQGLDGLVLQGEWPVVE